MGYAISIVTFNRREILAPTLEGIFATTQAEQPAIYVTDNGSVDGTADLLRDLEGKGRLRAWLLPENLGTSGGRNAHWAECVDQDTVRMDDKVLPLAAGWLTALKVQSDANHALVAPPYDPTVRGLESLAPAVEFVRWDKDEGRGGPLIYLPSGVTAALGGIDELVDDQTGDWCVYGWDDCLQIERARLLGWSFGFTLRCPVQYLAGANPERRAAAMRWHPHYVRRLHEYEEAERDLCLPLAETRGYKAAEEARGC